MIRFEYSIGGGWKLGAVKETEKFRMTLKIFFLSTWVVPFAEKKKDYFRSRSLVGSKRSGRK